MLYASELALLNLFNKLKSADLSSGEGSTREKLYLVTSYMIAVPQMTGVL